MNNRRRRSWSTWIVRIAVALALAVGYARLYLALARGYGTERVRGGICESDCRYLDEECLANEILKLVFAPAHNVDLLVRYEVWHQPFTVGNRFGTVSVDPAKALPEGAIPTAASTAGTSEAP